METIKADVVHRELLNMYSIYIAMIVAGTKDVELANSKEGKATYLKLKSINAVNTPTYRKLNELESIDYNNKNTINKFREIYHNWKTVKDKFPNSVVISKSDFINLCYKYDLTVDTLNMYGEEIPLDILDNLNNVVKDINKIEDKYERKFYCSERDMFISKVEFSLSPFNFNHNYRKISEFNINIDLYTNDELDKISNILTRCPIMNQYLFSSNRIGIIPVSYRDLCPSELLIAAPANHFISREIKINKVSFKEQELRLKLEDPIVFQYTNFGVIIHDKWGEVANDQIFGGV